MSNLKIQILFLIISLSLAQIEKLNSDNKLRSLKSKSKKKAQNKNKESSSLLQTLYTDSFSNNYYYTTLYITDKKIKQTYLIDTGSATMSSPCGPCEKCGKHKNNYFDPKNKIGYTPLLCDSKICDMVPSIGCMNKEKSKNKKNTCNFLNQKLNGDGLSGYYLSNVVYFEENQDLNSTNSLNKRIYKSHALPIGCTLAEYGNYKNRNVDGIMGINNEKRSFVSLLYDLKIINKNIFSLCFGIDGGYMSIGEIMTKYHFSNFITYVPFLNSTNYLIEIIGIKVGKREALESRMVANIDTGETYSYLPTKIFFNFIRKFDNACTDSKGFKFCGKFTLDPKMGYCAYYENNQTLFRTIRKYWPEINLILDKNIEYIWKPNNYYYFDLKSTKPRVCLAFLNHNYEKITLGVNFIKGYDFIFDKENQLLGFVPADCSRGNPISNDNNEVITPLPNKSRSVLTDKVTTSNENKEHYKETNKSEIIEFIQGSNKELEILKSSKLFKYIIILILSLIIVIALLIVIIIIIWQNIEYRKYKNILNEEKNKLNTDTSNLEEQKNVKVSKYYEKIDDKKDSKNNNNDVLFIYKKGD